MQRRLVTLAMGVFTVFLSAIASFGPVAAALAAVLAVLVVALATFGRERVAILAFAGAFATAPMYRGIGGIANLATPTDLLVVLGLFLLLPELVSRRSRLPAAYLLSLALLAAVGLVASLMNPAPVSSTVFLVQWLLFLGVLPAVVAVWQPRAVLVDRLLWCYLAGQLVSLVVALGRGAAINGRYQGLSHHPNDFGLAGATVIAILLYLIPRYRSARTQVVLAGFMVVGLASLILSGSRGATLATAVVLVLVPLVERSGVWTFLGLAGAALGLALLPYVLQIGGSGGSLARLAGDATAAASDNVREAALADGWHRFLGSPLLGTGLDIVVGSYHNMFLTVAASVGVFGLAAFLVICYLLIRPLVTKLPNRRLSYLPVVFLVGGITFPGLVDRTIVVPMAFAVLAACEVRSRAEQSATERELLDVSWTPVVLIGFNRPEHVRQTLAAIREVRPDRLFLIVDGPREGRPDDVALCAEVRAVMDSVDWDCAVHRRYSEVNLGCEGNVETGLDWVFGQVDDAIVLEDDCVADPSFFAYAAELLERYRDDSRVWQIAGNSHGVPPARFGDDSYRFAAWASVWGWATWADRWQRHRAQFPRDHRGPDGHLPTRRDPARPRAELLVTRGGRAHFAEAATSQDVVRHGWDKQWWLTMLTEGGLAATPAVNMVENIGFGAGATHGVYERETDPALPMPLPLHHPAEVVLDVEVERELELLLSRIGGRTVDRARRVVTNPRLRRLARAILHSEAAVRATRLASRLTDRRGAST